MGGHPIDNDADTALADVYEKLKVIATIRWWVHKNHDLNPRME